MSGKRGPVMERFVRRVRVDQSTGCWIWTGSASGRGYATMWDGRQQRYARHILFEIINGLVPKGMQLCHTCDVPRCVNPDHLFVGTVQENVADMIAKGRARGWFTPERCRGERNVKAKLTQAEVTEIVAARAAGEMGTEIAARYRVSSAMVGYIVRGQNWSHVTGIRRGA